MAVVSKLDERGAAGAILLLIIFLIIIALILAKMGYLDLGSLIQDIKSFF